MIRTSLVYLTCGFAAGALMLADRGISLGPWVNHLRPIHIEFLLLGWTVQLAFGVAFWILPRFRSGRERGREELAWTAFGLLNIGVLATAFGAATGAGPAVGVVGHCGEALAAVAFGAHAWPRAKAGQFSSGG
ncbi:MAG TPA: hypothetical protein VIG08_07340 [Gemmatimonadales bacterium]